MPAIHFGKNDQVLQVVVLQIAIFSAIKMPCSMESRRIQVVQIAEPASFSFSSCGIGGASLANTRRTLHDSSTLRVCQQVALHSQQDVIRVLFRESHQAFRECWKLDKL
jgi:hypothetical protein